MTLIQANSQFLRENQNNSKCVPRYWRLRQQVKEQPRMTALLDLLLFCSLSRQFFNRRQTEKDRVFKEAMAFLMSYVANRRDE